MAVALASEQNFKKTRRSLSLKLSQVNLFLNIFLDADKVLNSVIIQQQP